MPIAQLGQVNVSALNVPQALIQIVPPQYLFNGTPTNICGLVGTASWGPVNVPQTFGSYAQYSQIFGPTINRIYDMGGHVLLSQMQGASYYSGVRITDGSDVAASIAVPAGTYATGTYTTTGTVPPANGTLTLGGTVVTFVTGSPSGNQVQIGGNVAQTIVNLVSFLNASADVNISKASYTGTATVVNITYKTAGTGGNAFTIVATGANFTASGATLTGGSAATTGTTITSKYTGSFGNGIIFTIQTGQQFGTYRLVVTAPGFSPEVYDNVGLGLSGNALWGAITNAINNGNSSTRPPSQIVVATLGASTNTPNLGSSTLTGGTDGVTSITTATFLGTDAYPRTGMYALRQQNTSQFTLCDCSDLTSLSTQTAFGLSEGTYGIMATAASDTISNAATELSNQGIDTFTMSVIFGDWVLWIDTVNNIPTRLTSPAAVKLGLLGNLSPQNNSLNKPINGIVATQSSILGNTYSYADFQALGLARLDVIALDRSLTNNFIFRQGINTSSNPVIKGDEYTRVSYFLAKSFQQIANQYIGQVITQSQMLQATVSFQAFLALQVANGIIGTFDGTQAFQVIINPSNNTQGTVALGYEYAYIKVIYLGILRYFIVDLQGGSSVVIADTLTTLPTVGPTL